LALKKIEIPKGEEEDHLDRLSLNHADPMGSGSINSYNSDGPRKEASGGFSNKSNDQDSSDEELRVLTRIKSGDRQRSISPIGGSKAKIIKSGSPLDIDNEVSNAGRFKSPQDHKKTVSASKKNRKIVLKEIKPISVSNERNSVKLEIAMGKNQRAQLKERVDRKKGIIGGVTRKAKQKSLKSKLVNFAHVNCESEPRPHRPQKHYSSNNNSKDMTEDKFSLHSPKTVNKKLDICNNLRFGNSPPHNNQNSQISQRYSSGGSFHTDQDESDSGSPVILFTGDKAGDLKELVIFLLNKKKECFEF
jgi:hypothetical protein